MSKKKSNQAYNEAVFYFEEMFDWEKYAKLITIIARNKSLNLSGWKFMKSEVQSLGIESIVDDIDIFEYIDKKGVDFSFFKKDCVEDKTEIGLFHQSNRKKDGTFSIKEHVVLQMTNTRNGSGLTSKQQYLNNLNSEVLLLRQTNPDPEYQWAGLIDVSTLTTENVIQTDDQMQLKIPLEQIHFVYKGTKKQVDVTEVDFVKLMKSAVKKALGEILI
jgi:hypothetical protein